MAGHATDAERGSESLGHRARRDLARIVDVARTRGKMPQTARMPRGVPAERDRAYSRSGTAAVSGSGPRACVGFHCDPRPGLSVHRRNSTCAISCGSSPPTFMTGLHRVAEPRLRLLARPNGSDGMATHEGCICVRLARACQSCGIGARSGRGSSDGPRLNAMAGFAACQYTAARLPCFLGYAPWARGDGPTQDQP